MLKKRKLKWVACRLEWHWHCISCCRRQIAWQLAQGKALTSTSVLWVNRRQTGIVTK